MKVNISKYPKKDGERKISVKIEDHDIWNLDHTLALVIHPALVMLKDKQLGAPNTDDEDAPERLRSTKAKPKKNEYDSDSNHFKRWDWILGEMIFAFDQIATNGLEASNFSTGELDIDWIPIDKQGQKTTEESAIAYEMVKKKSSTYKFNQKAYEKRMARVKNGLRLFSKYYFGLWD
jgi:hypothetical protein